MKYYQHIGPTLDPGSGEWVLQVFNDHDDRAFIDVEPGYALQLAMHLIEYAGRMMVAPK